MTPFVKAKKCLTIVQLRTRLNLDRETITQKYNKLNKKVA